MKTITTDELKTLQADRRGILLINTLDESHFAATRISDALNVPQSKKDFIERVDEIAGSKKRPMVVYCRSSECMSSTQAAEKLDAAGFQEVYNYEGGSEAWNQEIEPFDAPALSPWGGRYVYERTQFR